MLCVCVFGDFANWLLGAAKVEMDKRSSGHHLGLPESGTLPASGHSFELHTTGGDGVLILDLAP